MTYTLLNIGYGSSVVANEIIAIVAPNSAPMRRLRDEAKEDKRLIDATHGRKLRSIIVLKKQPHCSLRYPDGNHLSKICHVK